MSRAKKPFVLLVALWVFALSSGAALAFFTSLGAGTGVAQVGSLTAPTLGTPAPGAGTVALSWTAGDPAPPSGTVSYTVSRGAGEGSVGGTCTGSLTLLSCQDSGLAAGTYHYTVTAHWRTWTAASNQQTATMPDAIQSTLTPVSSSITANGTATQVLTVQAKDTSGNNVSTGGASVTITRQSGTGTIGAVTDNHDGTYTATVTAPTSAGSGTFVATLNSGLVKNGGASQTQATVNYVAGAAATIAVSAGANQSATVSTAFATTFKALVNDSFGNPVPGATVTFTAPGSGASGTFKTTSGACDSGGATNAASCTATTNASGIATASTYTANGTAGAYSVTATASGATPSPLNFPVGNTTSGSTLTLDPTTACVGGSVHLAGPDGTLDGNQTPTVTVGGTAAVYTGGKTGAGGKLPGAAAITVPSLPLGRYLVVAQTTTKAAAAQLTITACITDVTLANGSGTLKKLDSGDSATVTFSEKLKASSFCATWADDPPSTVALTATVEVVDHAGNDTLDIAGTPCSGGTAFNLGSVTIGDYVGGGSWTFTGSTIAWDPSSFTLTITVGTLSAGTVKTNVTAKTPVYTADPAVTDLLGDPIGNSPFTDPTASGF